MTLNTDQHKILNAIQHGLPLSRTPYERMAQQIGISMGQLLGTLRDWVAEKKIRRIGAIVNHFQMGHGAGAMVVWAVPEERIDEVGTLLASFTKVSHAYQRPPLKEWAYNFYTMVHAGTAEELDAVVQTMSRQSGITQFRVLKTIQELKKVPPTYIGQR
jgi:siroheme decarboxylase